MQGATHFAAGMAATAIAFGHTAASDPLFCAFAFCAGSAGALIPDIDVEGSVFNKMSNDYIKTFTILVLITLVSPFLNGGDEGTRQITRILIGAAIVVATGFFSLIGSHRGFSHSLLAGSFYVLGIKFFLPFLAAPFALGYATHLLLDLLNHRPIRLFFPSRKGTCLNFFPADGMANEIVRSVCSGIATIGVIWCVLSALHII